MMTLDELAFARSQPDSEQEWFLSTLPEPALSWASNMLVDSTRTDTPADWAETAGRGHWTRARHHDLISQAATEAITGTGPPILIVEIPVRHGKSVLLSQYLTSWYLCRFPQRQVIMVSATQRLAERWSRRARGVIDRYGKDYYGVGVHPIRRSAGDWETDHGGGMLAAGVGGDIMGRDGDLIVVDDYIRNASDALSETIRDSQWDWFQSTLMRRLEPGGAVVMLATRWHTDDLIGRIKGGENGEDGLSLPMRVIRLPAVAEDNDELGRQPGEPLWPERWPLGEPGKMTVNDFGKRVPGLLASKADMDPFWWDAIYQQRPSREGLGQWPASYFDRIHCDSMPISWNAGIVAVDLAEGKTAKSGDYSAIVAVKHYDCKAFVQAQVIREPPELTIRRSVQTCIAERINHLVVEAQSFASIAAGVIERELDSQPGGRTIQVDVVRQIEAKISRIHGLGAYLSRDQIRVVEDIGGRMLVAQLRSFPHAKHDDAPDALEMALRYLPDAVGRPTNRVGSMLIRT